MLGKGGISVLQTSIFDIGVKLSREDSPILVHIVIRNPSDFVSKVRVNFGQNYKGNYKGMTHFMDSCLNIYKQITTEEFSCTD